MAAQADSGMALIMDSRTGELLAVAQLTMPTPSEPVTMREPPALPVWFIPPGDSTTAAAGSGPLAAARAWPTLNRWKRRLPLRSPRFTSRGRWKNW